MISQNSLFPLLLLCIAILTANALPHTGSCLANCATCEPNNLAICKGTQPCEWGHYDPAGNGTCIVLPTLTTLSSELAGKPISTASSWGEEAKYSTCEYTFQGKKKVVDVMGTFNGVTSLSKTFPVSQGQAVYMLSFNLLRDEWMPFSDFLMVEVSNRDETIHSVEISYEQRVKVESQTSVISCSGKRFMSEKYNIFITGSVGTELTVVFTSFLYNSQWALSNIKLLQGCQGFSAFNEKTQSCSKCDSDSYLVKDTKGSLWCEKCPQFCASCNSKAECTSCVAGAKLSEGKCSFSADYKIQQIDISNDKKTCGSSSFLLGYYGKTVAIPPISNDKNHLYDEIQIGFNIYYNPANWNDKTLEKIKVKINKGQIFTIGYQNLTNTATDHCKQFKGERMAMISLLSKSMVQVSSVLNIEFELVGKNNITFGVQKVFVKSLSKSQQQHESTGSNNEENNHRKSDDVSAATVPPSGSASSSPIPPTHLQLIQTQALLSLPSSVTSSQVHAASLQSTQTVTLSSSQTTSLSTQALPSTPTQLASTQNANFIDQTNASSVDLSPTLSNPSVQHKFFQYIPTVCQSTSGLQISVPRISEIKGYLSVKIDKLSEDNYEVSSSFIDDSTLQICLNVKESFIDGTITVYDNPVSSTARLLQGSGSTILAQGTVNRFDYLSTSQLSSISAFSVFFSVFAWAGVILIICAVMLGYGVTMEEFIFSLQLLFLHVYIASEDLPLSFREVIAGLRIVQNLNFFVPSQASSIEHQWLGNVIQQGPERLSLYNTDINFSREFYPILIINIIYGLWFCVVLIARRWLVRYGEKNLAVRVADNITKRIVNFADQAWRYQFLATIWFCILQFHNLAYPAGSNRSETMNAIFCICCFIGTLAWPLLVGYYCRKQYYENEYEQFIYQFEDLFYLRIPRYYLPTNHHRVGYRTFTALKSLFVVLLIACAGRSPAVLLFLLALQGAEIAYIRSYDIFIDRKYLLLKTVENCLFAALEVLLLVLFTSENAANSSTFIGIGWTLSITGMLIVLIAALRAGYLVIRKYSDLMGVAFEEVDPDQNKLKTERVV